MKICAIGDPHGDIKKVKKAPKDVDVYLTTGDLGKADIARKRFWERLRREKEGLPELEVDPKEELAIQREIYDSSMEILKHLGKSAPVYTIMGNVGTSDAEIRVREILYGIKIPKLFGDINKLKKVHRVNNRIRRIGKLRVGFLEYFLDVCWVREFKPKDKDSQKDAKKETKKVRRILKNFGSVDILVCHQPPYGYLDKVSGKYGAPKAWQGKHAGSKAILEYVKKYQPKYVFCGHIHEGEGKAKIGKSQVYNLGVGGNVVIEL